MGLFCVNMHFRTTDDKAVTEALKRRKIAKYRLIPAEGGWTTLYEDTASQQDDDRIRQLTGGLSKDLNVAAIAFLVHDSDIACYWLFDNGQLVDEFNSCPDYFDEDDDAESDAASGGQPEVLARYCKPGVSVETLAKILAENAVFAESVIEQLGEAMGIDSGRVLIDYRDASDESDSDGTDVEDTDEEFPAQTHQKKMKSPNLQSQLAGMFGMQQGPVDPQVAALVDAASSGKTDEIDRLLAEGAAVDGEAPATLPGADAAAGIGKILAGQMLKVPMTALLAAVVNKHQQAVRRLLAAGANPNRIHPLFGAPIHAACGAGDLESLRLLLDHGGDANIQNPQKLTPLGVIAAGRASLERIAEIQQRAKSMGIKLPGVTGQIANFVPPTAGWDACEKLLKERRAP